MFKKGFVAAMACACCFVCSDNLSEAAAPVVVSNKPLSVVNVNNGSKVAYAKKANVQEKKAVVNYGSKTAQTDKQKVSVKKAVTFANVELPDNYKEIGIYGDSVATKSQAVALIKYYNPEVKLECSVEELVDLYWQEAEREGVRPDLALAQALVETGYFRYGGDVHHNQNNFCGLGTTGNGVKGAEFKTPEIGVRAHIQHLLAYTQKKRPSTKIVDPRYELAHNIRLERGVVDTWYGLNGTWAMGSNYCEKIMVNYQRMLAMEAGSDAKVEVKKTEEKNEDKSKNPHRMRDLVEKLLRDK